MKYAQGVEEFRYCFEPSKYFSQVGEKIHRSVSEYGITYKHYLGSHLINQIDIGSEVPVIPGDYTENANFRELFDEYLELDVRHNPIPEKLANANGILIGGCGRSGTTLLLSILGSHPDLVAIDDELHCFNRHHLPTKLDLFLSRFHPDVFRKGVPFVEKSPKNVIAFEYLEKHVPNWKLIHMVRDGRDVVTSYHPTKTNEYWVPIQRWTDDTLKGLKSNAYMLKYEDLILDSEKTLRALCKFLELEWSDKLLNFEEHTNVTQNIAWAGGVTAIHSSRIGKWRLPKHVGRMQQFRKNELAVWLNRKLGYET